MIQIDLKGDGYAYGRVINGPVINFYDLQADSDIRSQEVVTKPVLFQVPVMNHAIRRWRIIGNIPLSPAEEIVRPRFMQDILDPANLRIYENGNIRPATRAECEALEREAVWDPEHVEDRLKDYFSGKPNKWVESLKLK